MNPTKSKSIRDQALRLISRREHTAAELSRKLRARGYGDKEISPLIADFLRIGYIDDTRAAELELSIAVRSGRRGLLSLKQRLHQRGVAKDVLSEVIERYKSEFDEESAALETLQRLTERGKAPEKAARLLASRGFSSTAIRSALRKLRLDNWNVDG